MTTKKNETTIHSSAAEYLTYIASVGGESETFEIRYQDENIWITQKMMASLYGVSKSTISEHISKVYEDSELEENESTVRKFRTVQMEGDVSKIIKSDVSIAKNYLSENEMRSLERIVSAYLELAEDRAERHIPMTMENWRERLDLFLKADDREVLQDAGKITAEIAKQKAEGEFEKYRIIQDKLFMSDYDRYLLELENETNKQGE